MAIVEVISNPVDTDELLERLCSYIYSDEKIDNKYCIGGRGLLNPYDAYADMKVVEHVFGKNNGRHAYHISVSFDKGTELIPDDAWAIAYELSSLFFQTALCYMPFIPSRGVCMFISVFILLIFWAVRNCILIFQCYTGYRNIQIFWNKNI